MGKEKSVAELKRELAKREVEEQKLDHISLADAMNDQYAGKAVFKSYRDHCGQAVQIIRYYKFKYAANFGGRVEFKTKVINIHIPGGQYSRGQASIERREHANDIKAFNQTVLWPTEEVPLSYFNKLWKDVDTFARAWYARVDEEHGKEVEYEHQPNMDDVPLDFPHVQLEPGDVRIFQGSPFLVPGDRYLITLGSITAAQVTLRHEQTQLDGGRHLYQECDMNYVNGMEARLQRLRQLIRDR